MGDQAKPAGTPSGPAWRAWDAASFAHAREAGKPIYVNVAARWCHWCHVMDAQTLAHPEVARLLDERFVAIRVDADARPDVAERYADWGWPANAFLTPSAQPVAQMRGFQEPDAFLALLRDLDGRARAGRLLPSAPAPAPARASGPFVSLRDAVAQRLGTFYDHDQGGWGGYQKYPFPGPVEWSLAGDAQARARATRTLDGMRLLVDPVAGGMYQYSVDGVWDEPHYEKIASVQAGALACFSLALLATGEPRWRQAAHDVARYVLGTLRQDDGPFGVSQDADTHDADGRPVPGAAYYRLPARGRARKLAPAIDRSVYADSNALLCHALVLHWQATGDADSLHAARRAVDALLRTHRTPAGAFTHAAHHGHQGHQGRHGHHGQEPAATLLHLRDNAAMGRALLALHEATADARYLDAAVDVAHWLASNLIAPSGALMAHTADPHAAGILAQRRTPLEDNGLAIRFLAELHWRTQDPRLREVAEQAARALAHPDNVAQEAQIIGQFLLGLEWLAVPATKAVLVGDGDKAAALRHAIFALPGPRWLARDDAHEYPNRPSPAVYLCRGSACSPPVTEAHALPGAVPGPR